MLRAQTFGRRLKAARVQAGWIREDVAAELAVNPVSVWRWETGRTFPNVQQAAQLAEWFGVPLDALTAPERAEDAA